MSGDGDLDGGISGSGGDGVLRACCGPNAESSEEMSGLKYGPPRPRPTGLELSSS